MRICLISNGKSEHIQRYSDYLASLNHEVHLIYGGREEVISDKVFLHHLSNLPFVWPLQTKKLVERIRPDIVDGHFINIYGFLAALSGFHPLVVTAWGSDIFVHSKHNPFWKFTTKFALSRADIINCLFPIVVAEPALKRFKVDRAKVRTGLLGVNTEEYRPLGFDANLAKEMGINSDIPVVINTRGFAPVYDYQTYFKAIPLVLAKLPEVKFITLYQKGYAHIGKRLAKQLKITENVILIEWIPRSEMPKLLSLANIYVSTSLSDGASNALFEAMACGVVPVVTDIAANHPWVKNRENGLLFPQGNSEKLAENIIYLLNSKSISSIFSLKCREVIQEKAEQNKEMSKIENTYHELMGI